MNSVMARLKNKLRVYAGDSEDLQHLRVLIDEPSYKMAQKIYKSYISPNDYSKFHAFMQELDRLLAKFGGKPMPPPPPPASDQQQQQQSGGKQQQQAPQQQQRSAPRQSAPQPQQQQWSNDDDE